MQFDDQTSSFAADSDSEERFRASMAPWMGPEKYPGVQAWAEKVGELDFVDSVMSNQIGFTGPEPEMDDWELQPVGINSLSMIGTGRAKVRIERAEGMREGLREGLREEVKEVWAEKSGKRKRDFDGCHQGFARGLKKRKV